MQDVKWNRSSTTRLARKFFGPFAYAKLDGGRVEIGINKHGVSVGIAWGADWQSAFVSLARAALSRDAEPPSGKHEGAIAQATEETKEQGDANRIPDPLRSVTEDASEQDQDTTEKQEHGVEGEGDSSDSEENL